MRSGMVSSSAHSSMAEEETDVLDWGNEDDAVSLGDEDDRYTLDDPASASQNVSSTTSSVMVPPATPPRSPSPPPRRDFTPSPLGSATPAPAPPLASKAKAPHNKVIIPPPRLTHALPPKPMTINIPYVPPSDPSIVEATLMASRPKKADTVSQNLKQGDRHDQVGPLPTPWEVGISRSGDHYYVNSVTGKSTWTRPSSNAGPVSTESPSLLTHDDRHYRPNDDRYSANSGRRREQSPDTSESRHERHYPDVTRSHDRSRSFSPARENRNRTAHRTARGRPNNRANGFQKELTALDLSHNEDRHWVPPPPHSSNTQARSSRRQNRPTSPSANDPAADTEVVIQPPQRESNKKGPHRDKNHSHTSPHYQSSDISAPRPITPPPRDDLHEAKAQVQRHEDIVERRRSPDPAIDPEHSARGEKPSRFGPGPVLGTTGGANGLPSKPMTGQDDRLRGSRRERRNPDRVDQDRRFDDPAQVYSTSTGRPSANATNNIDRTWVPAAASDRERTSPLDMEGSNPPPRKRPPLPPQEAEYRGLGKPKPYVYPEPSDQFRGEGVRSPTMPFHARENAPDVPPAKLFTSRDNAREGQYSHQPSGRSNMPVDYDREFVREQGRERGRSRHHFKDQVDQDGNFGMMDEHPPMQDNRGNYSDRQHEPPLKPRAMQSNSAPSAGVYPPPSLPISTAIAGDRYRGRPSPPHHAMPDNRRDVDMQLSGGWQQERREEWHPPVDRTPARESRSRPTPTSNANSIPIGSRRPAVMPGAPVSNEYPASAPTDRIERFERATYPPVNEHPTRQARPHDGDFSRLYHEPEPAVMGARQNFNRTNRNDAYTASPSDNSFSRERREDAESIRGPLSASRSENPMRRGGHRYPAGNRKSRYDPDHVPADSLPQDMRSAGRDTSPRGRYPDERSHDVSPEVTLPPSSRQTSFASSQSQWESTSPPFHDHGPRGVDYHKAPPHRDLPTHFSRMETEASRQGSGAKESYTAPVGDRYRRNEEFEMEMPGRMNALPPSRGANRRDGPFFPDRRPPAVEATREDIERGGGGRASYPPNVPFDEGPPQSARRILNDRIVGFPHPPPPPPPEGRGNRKQQSQEFRQDNGYTGEPDAFEPRVSEPVNTRQDNYTPLPSKTFEQRLETSDRAPMQKGSLLSRISRGGNEPVPPPSHLPQSLRDRVQVPSKRGRDEMVRDHFPDESFEADEGGDTDSAAMKRRKRRGPRRRGGPP